MDKVKGYNPEAGDCFRAEYSPDRKETAAGKVGVRINCHARQKTAAYIFTRA